MSPRKGSDRGNNEVPSDDEIKIYPSVKEFDENLPDTVELLNTKDGDKVYVIGTAHFSRKSQTDVSLVMRNTKPSAVVLELCPLRLHILHFDEKTLLKEATELGPEKVRQILSEQGVSSGMFYLQFLKTNAQITKQLGIAPGGECRRAVAEAKLLPNCKVLLGDRPLDITLNRAMAGLSVAQRLMLSMAMSTPSGSKAKITEEDVEKFKDRNVEPLQNMKDALPSVYAAFVTERDIVLAHSLLIAIDIVKTTTDTKPSNIVGVVGMGHMRGIIDNFGKTSTQQIAKLMQQKKKKWFGDKPNDGFPSNTSTLINTGTKLTKLQKFWPVIRNMFKVR